MPQRLRRAWLAGLLSLPGLTALAALAGLPVAPAQAQGEPRAPVQLVVDATDLPHRVMRVQQTLPVQAGPLLLRLPRWLPGQHAPLGDVRRLAGLRIEAAGQPLRWRRDALDSHAFHVEVPAGVRALQIRFEQLTPLLPEQGRVQMTPAMVNLQWNQLLLYPDGVPAARLPVQAAVRLPPGFALASALQAEGADAEGLTRFAPVSLEQLVDSPVFAGRHLRRIALEPEGAPRPVTLNLLADRPDDLRMGEPAVQAHRQLVQQADRLFGTRPFAHYDFLLALTEQLGPIGLEHHQSSENATHPRYLTEGEKTVGAREQLAHEYVHAWNGKHRRPAGQVVPAFHQPLDGSLLWLYEGQTEFWGRVLAVRSGLVSAQAERDGLAQAVAALSDRPGRQWRNLQDTTIDPQVERGRNSSPWGDWQRGSWEYYLEGTLIWLEADALIRDASRGQRSLDDFARGFFGPASDDRAAAAAPVVLGPRPYAFEDIVAALQAVWPHDWAGFLRQRLDGLDTDLPQQALRRAGWRLAWDEQPGEAAQAQEQRWRHTDLMHGLGLAVASDGKLTQVRWQGPAYAAGLAPGMVLLAVNGRVFSPEVLKAEVKAAGPSGAAALTGLTGSAGSTGSAGATGSTGASAGERGAGAALVLVVRDGDLVRSVDVDWRGGLRHPRLERLEGQDDLLGRLLAPR